MVELLSPKSQAKPSDHRNGWHDAGLTNGHNPHEIASIVVPDGPAVPLDAIEDDVLNANVLPGAIERASMSSKRGKQKVRVTKIKVESPRGDTPRTQGV